MGSIEEPTSFIRPKLYLPTIGAAAPAPGSIYTLPDLVDFNAQYNADHAFCYQARKREDGSIHRIKITHARLRDLVLCCQSWLSSNCADHISKSRPVALFMESDVGLWIHMLALLGLGVPALLLSARLSPKAIRHLMEKTNAGAALSSPRLRSSVEEALQLEGEWDTDSSPKLFERQSLEELLVSIPPKRTSVAYPGFYRGVEDRQVVIMHSSGTTGLPKPIYQPHEYLVGFAAAHDFAHDEAPPINLSTLPLYHGFGLCAPGISMSIGMTLCLPVSNVASGSSVIELLSATGATSLMTVPSTLEDISLLPGNAGIHALRRLTFVAFGGGPLKLSVGEKLASQGVPLLNHYGATEIGAISPILDPRKPGVDYDFHFFQIRSDHNIKMQTVPSAPSEEQTLYKLTARPLGWDSIFEVQDNLITRPDRPGAYFNSIGRNDDLIVLATGEKVLPNILETAVAESELCKAAIAIGQNQFQIGLLVEPKAEVYDWDHEQFRNGIWPVVEKANQLMDAQGRISSKKAIAIVPAGQTLPRTDKGSIQRKEVYRVFDDLITETFQAVEQDDLDDGNLPLLSSENLENEIKGLIQDQLAWKVPAEKWTVDDDLFDLGMDSLQAIQLRRLLARTAQSFATKKDEPIPREFVYSHPSVKKLAGAVRGQALSSEADLIDKYVGDYKPIKGTTGSVVLITGSTGSLGSHIVADLVQDPSVSQVICLIRPRDGGENAVDRQMAALRSKRLDIAEEGLSKIRAFATNTAAFHLGLNEEDWTSIRDSLTHVIHNAWPMDFNRQLPSFESQFMALDNLIELSRSAYARRPTNRQTFVFISSIATVGNYPDLSGEQIVREMPMKNNEAVDDFGYARAKLVCERIVEDLATNAPHEVDAKYIRVGQMTGAQASGLWNTTEHFPALAKSSKYVGALPQLKGTLSWLPVDLAASTVTDITFAEPGPSNIFHLENPVRQSWHDVLSSLAPAIGLSADAQIPYAEWLERIEAVSDDRMDENPAKKLLAFFKGDFEHMSGGDVIMDTAETRRVSETLRQTGGVDTKLLEKYVEMWKEAGFLK